jgi:branched-chain amino acid transport system permease protein
VNDFIQVVFNGLSAGAIYALVAVGVTLVFGLTGVVNFAQGQLLMLGAYATYAVSAAGAGFALALLAGVVSMGALGLALERGLFQFTLKQPITGFIVSLGLIPLLQEVGLELWGGDPKSVVPPITAVWEVGDVFIVGQRALIVAVTGLVLAGLYWGLRSTHVGRSLRACAQDREMTQLMGVNTSRLITLTFIIGSAGAGLAGALLVTVNPITPDVGGLYIFKGFAVALIGGLGSVSGALAAALAVGLAESALAFYVSSGWVDAYVLLIMLAILLVRPTGIVRGTEGAAVT